MVFAKCRRPIREFVENPTSPVIKDIWCSAELSSFSVVPDRPYMLSYIGLSRGFEMLSYDSSDERNSMKAM